MNVLTFGKMKAEGRRISLTTCYDYWSARILNTSSVDAIIVGDSVAMVMYGHATTLPATVEMMAHHTAAVVRGAPEKFIIADMPFLSYRKDLNTAMDCVEALVHAGAAAVKLEGAEGNTELIRHIVQSGVPVMGHLGLTPQSVNRFGGFKVQGATAEAIAQLQADAERLQEAGCFSLVLECVPSATARIITEGVKIPTIGIGAGSDCDGQVLVLQDLAGCNRDFTPKFVKTFANGFDVIQQAVNAFDRAVKDKAFPTDTQSYQ